jgi:hypothetical protein
MRCRGESKLLHIGVQGGPPEQWLIRQLMPVPTNVREEIKRPIAPSPLKGGA